LTSSVCEEETGLYYAQWRSLVRHYLEKNRDYKSMVRSNLKKAKQAEANKNFAEAEQLYREVLQNDGTNEAAFRGWVEMALGLSNFDAALQLCTQFLSTSPENSTALILMARAFMQLNQYEKAVAYFQHVLAQNPDHAEARYYFGLLCLRTGNDKPGLDLLACVTGLYELDALKELCRHHHKRKDRAETKAVLGKGLALSPNDLDLLYISGQVHMLEDEVIAALGEFKQIIDEIPEHAQAHFHYGHILDKIGWTHLGLSHIKIAFEMDRTNDRYIKSLIECHERLGQYEQALELVGLLEDTEQVLQMKAKLYDWLMRKDDFGQVISQLKNINPASALNLEKLDPKRRHSNKDLARLHQTVLVEGQDERSRAFTFLALGQFYHRNKAYEQAMDCYEAGHDLVRPQQPERLLEEIRTYQDIFTPERIARIQAFGSEDESPIFIVGMPRSGTSLLEAMLARHSEIAAAGELSFMLHAPKFINDLSQLDEKTSKMLSQGYLGRIDVARDGKAFVVDKMPTNFKMVGLVALLFPKAKFLHTTRHPIANGLSIYQQMFSGNHPYSHDLKNIADYYQDHVLMMDMWKNLFPNQIIEVNYEALVQDPQATLEQVLGFLGRTWEEVVLQQSAETVVRTASSWQVKQDVYTSSVEAWRNYEPYLADLIQAFEA